MMHLIILFAALINIPLMGAELQQSCSRKKSIQLSPKQTIVRQKPIVHQKTIQDFNYAIDFFEKNKACPLNHPKAALLLLSAYKKAEKREALSFINPIVVQKIYSYLSITQTLEGNIDEALSFAEKCYPHNYSMLTNRGLLYQMKAEKAHAQQTDSAENYHQKAFESFEKAAPHNAHAWQLYENLLFSNQKYTPDAIARSLFGQVPHIKDPEKRDYVLGKVSQLDYKDETISVSLAYLHSDITALEELYTYGKSVSLPRSIHTLLHLNQNIISKNTCIKKIRQIDPHNKKFKALHESHGSIIAPLLLQKREECIDTQHILYKTLSYLLGICAYSSQDYKNAYIYLKDSGYDEYDLLTSCLIFEAYLLHNDQEHYLNTCFSMLEKIFLKLEFISLDIEPKQRDMRAKELLSTTLINFSTQHKKAYLEEVNALNCCKLIYCMLMYFPTAYESACELFSDFSKTTCEIQQPEEIRGYQQKIGERLTELAQEKNHCSTYCRLAGSYLLQSSPSSTCLSLLLCALSHQDIAEEASLPIKKACTQVYCNLDMQSAQNLEKTIALHLPQAIRERAEYLSQQPRARELSQEIRNLCLLHTTTNDGDSSRAHSYNALALSLEQSSHPKDKKEMIHFIEQAIALGNYNCALLLGKCYESHIPSPEGQTFIKKNLPTAIDFYTQHINRANSRVDEAFFSRGLAHYKLGHLSEAYQDFVESYNYTTNLKQQAVSLFIQCLIDIQIKQDNELYPLAIRTLCQAYQKLAQYKKMNPTTKNTFNFFIKHMDEKAITAAEKIMTHIITTNNVSENALEWCDTMGCLIWQSVAQKPLDNPRRKNSREYLMHAANKGKPAATYTLSIADEKEISKEKKLIYINKALEILTPDKDADLITHFKNQIRMLSPITSDKTVSFKDIVNHPQLPLLVSSKDCSILKDGQFIYAITCEDEKTRIQRIIQLAKKRPALAHAHLLLAIHFCDCNNSNAQKSLIDALKVGLIIEKNKPAFFKDWLMIDHLGELAKTCMKHHTKNSWQAQLLTTLRHTLNEKKVNITAFEIIVKDLYECDLTKNPAWQKK